jgi:hypothetical protein
VFRRFTLHFTPTSASWINLVERLFASRWMLFVPNPRPDSSSC